MVHLLERKKIIKVDVCFNYGKFYKYRPKQKILGCIFTEKFENFDFQSCNNIFTPEIQSIMLASKVLKGIKKKKEVKNDLLSNMAPPQGLEPWTL